MIKYCFELDQEMPQKYGWRFSDVDSFKKQIDKCKTPSECNKVFWVDQARNIEAYSMTTFYRGVELLKPAIRSLSVKEIITVGVLARSLLELSCVYIVNANILEKTFSDLKFPENTIVNSKEIETMIVKMIWGTRLNDPDEHLKQKNVLSYIQKVSRYPNGDEVMPTYEYLCEIAHPSFIGNTRFWSHVEKTYPDGSQQRVVCRHSEKETVHQILDKTIWTLAWSATVLRNSFHLTQSALAKLLSKVNYG